MRLQTTETHLVSRDAIRRFACAIGAADPIHIDTQAAQAAGYRDIVAPAPFYLALGLSHGRTVPRDSLGVEGLPLADDLAGRKVVAGETTVSWYGEICAGDEISVAQRLQSRYEKVGRSGRLEFYVYEREYSRSGSIVVREMFTRIAR